MKYLVLAFGLAGLACGAEGDGGAAMPIGPGDETPDFDPAPRDPDAVVANGGEGDAPVNGDSLPPADPEREADTPGAAPVLDDNGGGNGGGGDLGGAGDCQELCSGIAAQCGVAAGDLSPCWNWCGPIADAGCFGQFRGWAVCLFRDGCDQVREVVEDFQNVQGTSCSGALVGVAQCAPSVFQEL